MMRKLYVLWQWAEDSYVADAVGVALLFGLAWLFLAVTP